MNVRPTSYRDALLVSINYIELTSPNTDLTVEGPFVSTHSTFPTKNQDLNINNNCTQQKKDTFSI